MKLGLSIGYSGAQMDLPVERILRAEKLGYDSVWTAGDTVPTRLRHWPISAAITKRIKLGTGIIQVSARTPANCAMSMGTVDALAGGGRAIAGLGVSGPQIVEGGTVSLGANPTTG